MNKPATLIDQPAAKIDEARSKVRKRATNGAKASLESLNNMWGGELKSEDVAESESNEKGVEPDCHRV